MYARSSSEGREPTPRGVGLHSRTAVGPGRHPNRVNRTRISNAISSEPGDAQDPRCRHADVVHYRERHHHQGAAEMLAATFGTGQVFWSILWFTVFFLWLMLLFYIFGDIFRSPDLSGWSKALWSIFVIFMPYLGVFVYLIARGKDMQQRSIEQAQAQEAAARAYIKDVASAPSSAEELARLADLKAQGVLTDEEFAAAKAKLISG